ncbi:unnamed protein product [Linum trigynum]|uniref:Uncharacterized protein n=1 Tax=Linum trigynum TaxID=586398 RepID=A0AAV2F5Z5_9ROSI
MRCATDLEDNIQFQLVEEYHHMSIQEFTRALDIYLTGFVDSPNDFSTLTRESDFPCFKVFYESKVKKPESRQWDVRLSKASEIKPEWRLIHHAIARSVGGKNQSKGNLITRDITLFHSMRFPQSLHLGLSILSIFKPYEMDHRLASLHGGV